jgi:hypothetical protein
MFKRLVLRLWTYPMKYRTIIWTRRIRIFCDGGYPIFRWVPRFRHQYYDQFWGLCGFAIYLWGRELNFCFGTDRNNLYHNPHGELR